MTREEYRQLTDLKTAEEARCLLQETRWAFALPLIASFICARLLRLGYYPNQQLILGIYFVLIARYLYVCFKVIKKTKNVTKAEFFLAIILAPISWIWFYPLLIRPLEIIAGDLEPPIDAPKKKEQTLQQKRASNFYVLRVFLYTTAVAIALVVIVGIVVAIKMG